MSPWLEEIKQFLVDVSKITAKGLKNSNLANLCQQSLYLRASAETPGQVSIEPVRPFHSHRVRTSRIDMSEPVK